MLNTKLENIKKLVRQVNYQKFNENLFKVRAGELMHDLGIEIHELFCEHNIEVNVTVKENEIMCRFEDQRIKSVPLQESK